MQTFLTRLLLSSFLLSLFSFTNGEYPITCSPPELGTVISGNGGNQGIAELDENCIGEIEFNVLMVNLGDFQPNEDFCSPCQLPAGYEPMNLRVSLPEVDVEVYEPIVNFSFAYTAGNGTDVYEGKVRIYFDASGHCTEIGHTFEINWEAQLLVDAGGTNPFSPYPICEHAGPGDIFDCTKMYFMTACPMDGCPMTELTLFSGTNTFECIEACSAGGNSSEQEMVVAELEITPNPFNEDFTISWSSGTDRPDQIELFDVNGRILKSWTGLSDKTAHTIHVDTRDISKGIYFTKVTFTDKSYDTFRLIKQ